MYHKASTIVVFSFIALFLSIQQAQARTKIECRFDWDEARYLNVKSSGDGHFVTQKVRTREYNRLVQMGEVKARVSLDAGGRCTLNHPENHTIDLNFIKDKFRLNLTGRIPRCSELNAYVTCAGEIGPRTPDNFDSGRSRQPVTSPESSDNVTSAPPPSLRGVTPASPPPPANGSVRPSTPPPPK